MRQPKSDTENFCSQSVGMNCSHSSDQTVRRLENVEMRAHGIFSEHTLCHSPSDNFTQPNRVV